MPVQKMAIEILMERSRLRKQKELDENEDERINGEEERAQIDSKQAKLDRLFPKKETRAEK